LQIRKRTEQIEQQTLSQYATLSSESKGRQRTEKPCPIRTCFQRDRDRIIHSKSFRRLKHKTQVFLAPTSDHYRTRLTHVIEVSQIARTIARSLRLNEDLTEAIALGHDLGHTPFGHAGEEILNEIHPGGFKHVIHSLRVVDVLEKDGKGLNLSYEVRDGISKHSKGMGSIDNPKVRPETMEGQVVRVSDLVAYANHDLDDALRSGIIKIGDVPKEALNVLGRTISKRVNSMVTDIIVQTQNKSDGNVYIGGEVENAILNLRGYLFENVYMNEVVKTNFIKARKILKELYEYFCANPDKLWEIKEKKDVYDNNHNQIVCDFIAGMTDSFAISLYEELFLPKRWSVEFSK
jgi:dGTPase